MLEFIARFSPRLEQLMALPRATDRLLTAIEDVVHDQGVAFPSSADPKVQIVLNEVKAVRQKLNGIGR